jgi:hypothetical protein
MTFEEMLLIPATGFAFEAPVPLPLLGHKLVHPLRIGSIETIVYIEMKMCEAQRVGTMRLSASGSMMYHDRDRFGIFAYSRVELRFNCDLATLVKHNIVVPVPIPEHEGAAIPKPGFLAYLICANAFNYFVDLHTIAYDTHWIPHITPEDIHSLTLMDWWSDPKSPKSIGMIAGIPGAHRFVFGKQEHFPPKDPKRVGEVLSNLPLHLWEEVFHSALRDFEVGRLRSAAMHACLGVECYLRAVLTLNAAHVPDSNYLSRTLKPLATRKTCLPSLLGYTLDSASAPEEIRNPYVRIAALRDSVMHTGELTYQVQGNEAEQADVNYVPDLADHIDMALSLVSAIGRELKKKGFAADDRGMIPAKVLREQAEF